MADPIFKELAYAALEQTARNPTQDFLRATPRNPVLGYLADLAASSYAPQRTQQMQGIAQFFGAPAVSQTLDRLSYGEPLTTGAGGLGGTTRIRPEAIEAAVTMTPMLGPAARMTKGLPVGMSTQAVGGMNFLRPQAPQQAKKVQSIVREGNPIQSAVVLIGDKLFTGRTHSEAFNRAIFEGTIRKENGKFIYPKGAEVNSDLFMTKDGQIIDRFQASKMFDIGASETAIKEGLMQNKPASSMSIDSYMEQANAIRQQKEKPSFTYPQDEALRLAQQRAALPVERGGLGLPAGNTAAERAAAMGFDKDVFHGTNTLDIEKIDPTKARESVQYMPGFFTAENPQLAQNFGEFVMPMMQKKGTTVLDKRAARIAGEDVPIVDTVYDKTKGILVTNNPDNVRSRFAAFDPFRRTAAIAATMGVAAPDLLAQEQPNADEAQQRAMIMRDIGTDPYTIYQQTGVWFGGNE